MTPPNSNVTNSSTPRGRSEFLDPPHLPAASSHSHPLAWTRPFLPPLPPGATNPSSAQDVRNPPMSLTHPLTGRAPVDWEMFLSKPTPCYLMLQKNFFKNKSRISSCSALGPAEGERAPRGRAQEPAECPAEPWRGHTAGAGLSRDPDPLASHPLSEFQAALPELIRCLV